LSNIDTKILPCKIDSINLLTRDVISVVLRLPPNSNFNYLPGQYISLYGPSGEKRSYSISSYNLRKVGKIELYIKLYEKGLFSEFFANIAKVNDLMRLEGPLGTFFLRDKDVSRLIFVATGTGIAPIKAIIEGMKDGNSSMRYKEIYIYYGARFKEDVFFDYKEFAPDNICFNIVFSRNDNNSMYVQDAVLKDFSSLEDTCVYACGSDKMIRSAYDQFINNKLDPKLFFSDIFLKS